MGDDDQFPKQKKQLTQKEDSDQSQQRQQFQVQREMMDHTLFWTAWHAILNKDENFPNFPHPYFLNVFHPVFGMTLLHAACATDNLLALRSLVRDGAPFVPDRQGRFPSIIAAECEASDELLDFVAEMEEQTTEKDQ
jgi:hypothetical protein